MFHRRRREKASIRLPLANCQLDSFWYQDHQHRLWICSNQCDCVLSSDTVRLLVAVTLLGTHMVTQSPLDWISAHDMYHVWAGIHESAVFDATMGKVGARWGPLMSYNTYMQMCFKWYKQLNPMTVGRMWTCAAISSGDEEFIWVGTLAIFSLSVGWSEVF